MAERYKIYEQLGAGGVGAVFRAYDTQLKRWVAIKRLLNAADAASDSGEELRREADALASLRNPNVVTVFDVATDAEGLFMVMELLEGEDLANVVQHGPLHYDDFKELASQTLEALMAAHQRHILHRDIKPENIKVERLPGGRMQSKLIDFGLARAGLRARRQTEDQEGSVMGSVYYMAPEQLTREPVDERTDLYSLGCVFYEALSGRKAFNGESMAAVIDQHIDHNIVALQVVAPHVPPWLGAWVARLMARQAQDRPGSAQQAIEEFRAWERMPVMMPYGPWGGYMPPPYGAAYPGALPQEVPPQVPPPQQPAAAVYAQPAEMPAEPAPVPVVPVQPATPPPGSPVVVPVPAVAPAAAARRPSAPVPAPRRQVPAGGGKVKPVRADPVRASSRANPRSKRMLAAAGGGVLVVAIAGFMWVRGGNGGDAAVSGGAATSSFLGGGGPPKVELALPADRMFPPASDTICLHLVAGTGMFGERKGADGKPVPADDGEAVVEWHDISPLGNNNLMRAFQASPAHAPRRVMWPADPNAAGPRLNRPVLDFSLRDGKPCALNLTDVADEKAVFPFGGSGLKGDAGLTLACLFQADPSRLPTKILTLSGDGPTSVAFTVDAQKQLVAEVRRGGLSVTIRGRNLDATQPCTAVLSWQQSTGALELRGRDAQGANFKILGDAVPAPDKPLVRLQLGQVQDGSGKPVPAADQFAGYLADVVLYASALRNDQIQLLESKALRDYYFQGPPPPPKP